MALSQTGTAILLVTASACARGQGASPAPGVRLLPEEAWLYARTSEGTWSAEIEEESIQPVPPTDELKLQLTQPLAEFRVRLIDERGTSVPHDGSAAMHAPTGQQVHTMRFPRALAPGKYRIVIDAPLGGVLRDAAGRRYRGQRFRIAVEGSRR